MPHCIRLSVLLLFPVRTACEAFTSFAAPWSLWLILVLAFCIVVLVLVLHVILHEIQRLRLKAVNITSQQRLRESAFLVPTSSRNIRPSESSVGTSSHMLQPRRGGGVNILSGRKAFPSAPKQARSQNAAAQLPVNFTTVESLRSSSGESAADVAPPPLSVAPGSSEALPPNAPPTPCMPTEECPVYSEPDAREEEGSPSKSPILHLSMVDGIIYSEPGDRHDEVQEPSPTLCMPMVDSVVCSKSGDGQDEAPPKPPTLHMPMVDSVCSELVAEQDEAPQPGTPPLNGCSNVGPESASQERSPVQEPADPGKKIRVSSPSPGPSEPEAQNYLSDYAVSGSLSHQRGPVIGKGSFGEVYQGILTNGRWIAVKVISLTMDQEDLQSLFGEVDLMKKLSHRNITRFLGAEYDRNVLKMHIFMEYVDGGSLASIVKKLPSRLDEKIATQYTRQLVQGLKYLHQMKVVHRDIKGDNVLVSTTGVVKLADFGCSKVIHKVKTKTYGLSMTDGGCETMVGTPYWMAPEVITAKDAGTSYGLPSDVWSVGCTVAEILNRGSPPWPRFTNMWQAVMFIWEHEGLPPNLPKGLSKDANSFIEACLVKNPKQRPKVDDLLQHSFIRGVDVTTVLPGTHTSTSPLNQLRRLQDKNTTVE